MLPKQLSPHEIGQFMHSITDLPRLAEYLDPNRSKTNLDFLVHYNTYGCADTRVFNWTRIRFILGYPRLSWAGRLILLNGKCISQWPGLLTVLLHDLTYFLSLVPESNPLRHLNSMEIDAKINWLNIITNHNDRWKIILNNAQSNSDDMNFIPYVDELVENGAVSLSEHFLPIHFSLIGPKAIESCYISASNQASRRACSNLVSKAIEQSRNFKPRDSFYWALNLATSEKYSRSTRLSMKFAAIRSSCSYDEPRLVNFVTDFSKMFIEWADDSAIESIFAKLLSEETILSDEDAMEVDEANSEAAPHLPSMFIRPRELDPLFMAIEFYYWICENFFDFRIQIETRENALQAIQRRLGSHKPIDDVDYYLDFFLNGVPTKSVHVPSFKSFILGNYDQNKPNISLIKALRQVSWINGPDGGFKMTQILKSFINHETRLNNLRKICFKHPHEIKMTPNLDVYIGDDMPFEEAIFTGVFESLLMNDILVYPLNVNIYTSAGASGLIGKDPVSLEAILQNFWLILGSFSGSLMCPINSDDEDDDEYSTEQAPYPWTHPNVMMVVGCVMTLALLHGIKLKNWRLKRSLFESLFRINLTSATEDETQENSHFTSLHTLNDYLKAIQEQSETDIRDSIDDLVKIDSGVNPKLLRNYQKITLAEQFEAETESVWAGKVFRMVADLGDETITNLHHKEIFSLIPSQDTYKSNLNPRFIIQTIDSMTFRSAHAAKNVSREMAKFQIYSLYLGVQPLTRYLNAKDAYEAIFRDSN